MRSSFAVIVTGIENEYRKLPVAPMNSASKTGLDTMLGPH